MMCVKTPLGELITSTAAADRDESLCKFISRAEMMGADQFPEFRGLDYDERVFEHMYEPLGFSVVDCFVTQEQFEDWAWPELHELPLQQSLNFEAVAS